MLKGTKRLIKWCVGLPLDFQTLLTLFHQEIVPSLMSNNTFDHLPALSAPRQSYLRDKLERYLSTDPEEVADALLWWFERKHLYPCLYRMALDYLSIPCKSLYFVFLLLFND